jgi:hypothetical protein
MKHMDLNNTRSIPGMTMSTYGRLLFLVLSMTALTAFSQRPANVQVDLGLVQNHKGFFKLFNGVMEAGIGYNRELTGNLFAGASLRISMLARKGTTNRLAVYKPGINLHYYVHLSERFALVPQASAGYSFLSISNKEYGYQETQSGWNSGAELRLLWMTRKPLDFYLFGRFDAIFLNEDEDFTRLGVYRQVFMTAIGLGIRIKSKAE